MFSHMRPGVMSLKNCLRSRCFLLMTSAGATEDESDMFSYMTPEIMSEFSEICLRSLAHDERGCGGEWSDFFSQGQGESLEQLLSEEKHSECFLREGLRPCLLERPCCRDVHSPFLVDS